MSLFRDVVTKHHSDSDAVLVAAQEPCISIAYDERENVAGRSFRIEHPDGLADLMLRESWIMAVLLCPGDNASLVAAWVRAGNRDPRRILFYVHPRTNPRKALAPWRESGLPVHSTWTVRNWRELHRHFGAAWNVRVFDDFRPR
jgi:hypothetical protein